MDNKKILLVAAAILAMVGVHAQEHRPVSKDTVVVNKDTVVFNSRSYHRTSNQGGATLDFDLPFYHKLTPRTSSKMGFSAGAGMLFTDQAALFNNPQNSFEYHLFLKNTYNMHPCIVSYGAGVTFRNYAMTGEHSIAVSEQGTISVGLYPPNSIPGISKLRVFSASIPLMFGLDFGRGFGLILGPVINLNVASSVVNKCRVDDEPFKDKFTNTRCNLVTVDPMFQLNLKYFGLYVKYSPMSVMDKSYCPAFQTWSFGVEFF